MATAVMELKPSSNTNPGLFSSLHHRKFVVSLLLILGTLLIYNPVVHNGFVGFDDPGYITTNKHIHSGLTWKTIEWAFSSTAQANWHPLTWLSHALDWELFGARPAGHHYTSLILHALCAVLLFLFLEGTTGMMWRSATVAALFAIHPINVESVAWAAERKNILCMVFFFLALLAYRNYVSSPSLRRYLMVVLWFCCGLMSKPMVITFPFVLLLLDYWPFERTSFLDGKTAQNAGPASTQTPLWKLLLEKVPFFALMIASAVITMVAQRSGRALRGEYSLTVRLMNAIVSYSLYIKKAFWPSNLSPMYPHPGNTIPVWEVVVSSIFIGLITFVVLKFRQQRYLVVGWFWFVGTLVPVIGLVQVGDQGMADRYAYLPLIGFFIATVWGIADLTRTKQIAAKYLAVIVLIAIGSLSVVTHIQIGYWRDSMTLWSHALKVTPHNFVAHDNMGVELLEEGRLSEAKAQFQAAIAINHRDAFSQLNLGVCEKNAGNMKAAADHYEAALEISSDPMLRSVTFGNLGAVYRRTGDYSQARWDYTKALDLDPDNAFALVGMGIVLQKTGDLTHAVDYYSKAVASSPSDVGYLLLAQSLEKIGQHTQADAAFTEAKRISANFDLAKEATNSALN